MRERIPRIVLVRITLAISVLVMISACSSSGQIGSVSNKNSSSDNSSNNGSTSPVKVSGKDKDLKHIHPPNPCTDALEHSHAFTEKDHEHSYDCENTNDIVINGHVHPANDKQRLFRHVHPNGANKHSHYRE